MNHKRKRPKNVRRGCLMCKPHKMNGVVKTYHVRGIKALTDRNQLKHLPNGGEEAAGAAGWHESQRYVGE